MCLSVRVGTQVKRSKFALYQNQPKPFIGTATIDFSMVESEEANLTVYDASGKILLTQTDEFAKGYN